MLPVLAPSTSQEPDTSRSSSGPRFSTSNGWLYTSPSRQPEGSDLSSWRPPWNEQRKSLASWRDGRTRSAMLLPPGRIPAVPHHYGPDAGRVPLTAAIRMVTTARWSHPRISTAGGGGRCPWSHGRPGTVRSGRMVAPALCAVVAWSPGTAAPWRRERRGRLQEAVARLAAAGRVQPAQMLAADLPTEPVAELLPDVGHRGPGERAGLLGAQPAELQALDVPAAPAVHHGQQGGVGAGADRGPGLLWPGAQLGGEVGQEHQVPRRPVGMAGHQVVQHLAVWLGDLLVQQGGRN